MLFRSFTPKLNRGNSISSNIHVKPTIPKKVKKKTVSNKDPSEETIAIFGAYGVTGQYFLKFAMEAGYKIHALLLPGIKLEDFEGNPYVRFTTGTYDDIQKVRSVVRKASYVVCLLNDCGPSQDPESLPPPKGNTDDGDDDGNNLNLNFMHNLVPILEESNSCRVLLYQVSAFCL